MKKTLLLFMLFIASIPMLFSQEGVCNFTATNISGGIIANVKINEAPANVEDIISAYDPNGICAGNVLLFDYGGQTFCSLQVYGDDTTTPDEDEGMNEGETIVFKLWIAATGEVLDHPMDLDPVEGWNTTLTGQPVPGWDFADGKVINFMRDGGGEPVPGCMDATACNYNSAATEDDMSCVLASGCDTCSGETDGTGTVVDNPEAGEACDDGDANTENDAIQEDCSCAGDEIVIVDEDSDECATAVNISLAFTEECEMAGPYEQGDATTNPLDPELGCIENPVYDGTTWYSFVVPDNIADGNPTDYVISTGAFADCTSNPLEGNADTQIAVYDGTDGCPSATAVSIACNDDFSENAPYVSSLQVTLTPGDQYYIMVETFGSLSGEFCFYIQPLANFATGGTKDCAMCDDGICNLVIGESFTRCPGDCPCDASFDPTVINDGIPGMSLDYNVYCPEDVGGNAADGGVYIPFVISSSNVPMGPDNVTFLNSTLTSTVGSLFNFVISGSGPATPTPLGDATQNVTLLYLSQADIDAVNGGAQIVLEFTDESGGCNIVAPVDVDLSTADCGGGGTEGCTTEGACNYNPDATIDDGSCNVPDAAACEACDGDTIIVNDADGDGVCDADEVPGCTDMNACNFDATATDDDGSCTTEVDCAGECGGTATEDCDGVCGGDANAGADCTTGDGTPGKYNGDCECIPGDVPGCTNMNACNFDSAATVDDESCIVVEAGSITLANGSMETSICVSDDVDEPVDIAVVDGGQGPNGAWVITDTDLNILALPDAPPFTLDGAGAGTCLIWWVTFDDLAGADVGENAGDLTGCFALSNSLTVSRLEDCGDIPGCMDMGACNFDPEATVDDGSCAENDCAGVCDGDAVAGSPCTDVNGNESAYAADCSCPEAPDEIVGCMDETACNFDPAATIEGDCYELDCAGDCNGTATEDCAGECNGSATEDCEGVCGGDAVPGASCGGDMPGVYNSDCECIDDPEDVEGCMDMDACNFDPAATIDDGSCEELDCAGDCGGSATEDCEGVCGGAAVVGADCDDGNPDTVDDAYNGDCECEGRDDTIDDCMSEAGNLTLVEGGAYGGMNYICAGDCASVSAGDFLLDAGQGVKIVWHTDGEISETNFPPANVIGSGSFYCNEGGVKETVYATAFGALKDAEDEIDYTDYCLTFSNTIAITFLAPIEITVTEDCDAANGNFTFNLSVDGGLPECIPGESYTVSGDYFNGEIAPGETQSVGPIPDGTEFSVSVTDPNGCTATYTDEVSCSKLPITLEVFNGEAINQGNLLKWVTSTEINNDYFSLQASTNGVDFTTIARIEGQGNSNTPVAYEHLDRAAAKGATYYQLIQTDYDGTQSKSKVIQVMRGEAAFNITDLRPVPATDMLTIQFVAPEDNTINIELFDLIGHTLRKLQHTSDGGITQMDINVDQLPAGVYFISLISNTDKVTQKFVIE